MIESIILMTAGLLLDICGAFLIVKLFLNHAKNSRFFTNKDGEVCRWHGEGNFEDELEEEKRQEQSVSDARYGFAFLAIGFTLILIASWINYFEIH